MTTADTKPSDAGKQLIEQRLDALDRALLGILPRSERLALVMQVETRVRELTGGNTAAQSSSEMVMEPEAIADTLTRRETSNSPKRRSRLALSSGILGIVALALLFAIPITYLVVMFIGEGLGEFVSIALLSIHMLAVAIGGLVALVMGIAGLVSLARRKGRLVGHGWAITGLCTAPLPTFVGGLMVLVTALSLFAVQTVELSSTAPPQLANWSGPPPGTPTSCEPTLGSPYAPAPSYPPSLPSPLPLSAAPTYYPPGSQSPQFCPAPSQQQSTIGFPSSSSSDSRVSQVPTLPLPPAPTSGTPQQLVPPPASAVPAPLR